jgi:hypothetical protein
MEIARQSQDAVSDRIPIVVVVEQPGIELAFAEGRLDTG